MSEAPYTPTDLIEKLKIVVGQLRIAWSKPKTDEQIARIHDLGLHFRLLTDAYDAEVARRFPEEKEVGP